MKQHTSNSRAEEFRMRLQQEFVSRCRKNPKYSLRAFARSLGIEASPLSAILRGKRPITNQMKQRLGLALGMNLDEVNRFQGKVKSVPVQQLALDAYSVIADWYHFAILELVKVKGFKGDLDYIAKTLGISRTEAHIAVERLKRLELLTTDGKWVDTSSDGLLSNIDGELTSQAHKKLQKQILEMAIEALEELPMEVRNHTSMTMAINPEDLPEAKKRIQEFRRELCAFFESNHKPTQVYHLALSLYPASKGKI